MRWTRTICEISVVRHPSNHLLVLAFRELVGSPFLPSVDQDTAVCQVEYKCDEASPQNVFAPQENILVPAFSGTRLIHRRANVVPFGCEMLNLLDGTSRPKRLVLADSIQPGIALAWLHQIPTLFSAAKVTGSFSGICIIFTIMLISSHKVNEFVCGCSC